MTYGYAMSPPLATEEVRNPMDPETTLFRVHGEGQTVFLPSSPPHTGWVVYGQHDMPSRLHPEGCRRAVELLFAASALALAYARHDRGAEFARALSAVLWAHRWTHTSAWMFVACVAEAAGDRKVAHQAAEGRFTKRSWKGAEQAFQVLRGSAQDPQWARVRDGLREDPRLIQRQWQLDHFATIGFVDMVEDIERHERYHRRA